MNYKTHMNTRTEAWMESDDIANLLKDGLERFLGSTYREIQNGNVVEWDYHYKEWEVVREATSEEVVIYNSFNKVIDYFENEDINEGRD